MLLLRAGPVAIVLWLGSGAGAYAAPPSSTPPSSTPFPSTAPAQDQLEQRKLELEIEKLEHDAGEAATLRAWLPVGTILVGLAAAGFGMFQYFRDQRTSTAIRVQEQYSTNLASLVQYAEPDSSTSVRAVAALVNLRQVVPLAADSGRYRDQVTDIIATMVHDLDFDDSSKVRFDAICLERWPEYATWLQEHPENRNYLLYKYQRALTSLREAHPQYFRQLRVSPSGFVVPDYIEEKDYTHFRRVVAGYQRQLDTFPAGPDRQQAVTAFGTAIGNEQLARDLFDA
jgi:hypothetical protein